MAESNEDSKDSVLSENDPLDINELASLNEDITDEFIEQLQSQIKAGVKSSSDGDLFEEVQKDAPNAETSPSNDSDDDFMKKYKAKLNKIETPVEEAAVPTETIQQEVETTTDVVAEDTTVTESSVAAPIETPVTAEQEEPQETKTTESTETVSPGDISEKPLTKEISDYNKNLDYLDNNVKYSKYVIYVDPENQEFIGSLTVKERKNLINRILKEQDAIALTKRRLGKAQTILTHAIVAIITIAIAIPCVYWTINASLEATINNYRASQSIFEQLYKEKGKIQTNRTK